MAYELAWKGNTDIDPDAQWSVVGTFETIMGAIVYMHMEASKEFKTNDVRLVRVDNITHAYKAMSNDDGDGREIELGRYEVWVPGRPTAVGDPNFEGVHDTVEDYEPPMVVVNTVDGPQWQPAVGGAHVSRK